MHRLSNIIPAHQDQALTVCETYVSDSENPELSWSKVLLIRTSWSVDLVLEYKRALRNAVVKEAVPEKSVLQDLPMDVLSISGNRTRLNADLEPFGLC